MKKQLIAIAATSLILAGTAYAAGSKSDHSGKAMFGVVSMQQIVQNSSKVKSMQASMQAQAKPMEDKLNKESAQVQKLSKDPKQAKQAAAAKAQFQKDVADFQNMQKKQQTDLKNLLMSSIDAVRTQDHLQAIFIKAAVLSSDSSSFTDVTAEVQHQLDKTSSK